MFKLWRKRQPDSGMGHTEEYIKLTISSKYSYRANIHIEKNGLFLFYQIAAKNASTTFGSKALPISSVIILIAFSSIQPFRYGRSDTTAS